MLPALQSQIEITTWEQYEALSEDRRIEIFEGAVYDMASPSQEHQTILTELLVLLRNYVKSKGGSCAIFPAPFDVKLNDTPLIVVQPDLMIVCDKNKLDGKRCNGAPDFIIEIVSPNNSADDYIRKLHYYKDYGVREYWIVDPQRQRVIVYYFGQADLEMEVYTFQDTVRVNIYDDLYLDFSKLDFSI